ncbi:SPFH domain-containing protein [Microbulbifer sp. 2201CG32-9]|uniref:SPFH domain-containing protein n=1 Tax=Microbulbifer sp. 2201CG32-9 TaxID=3232309 RepID=UPI00345BA11C
MLNINYIKVDPTTFLIQFVKGRARRKGNGLALWYYAPTTSLVAIPSATTDLPFIFKEITKDFQEITVQGQLVYRIAEPEKIAALMNFTLKPESSGNHLAYSTDDPEKLRNRIANLVQVKMRSAIEQLSLRQALNASQSLMKTIKAELAKSEVLDTLGVEVVDLSIVAIKPTPETARALEAAVRERLLEEADVAIYRRRNASIEQEKIVKENELNGEIAIEVKQREIEETRLAAERATQEQRNKIQREQLDASMDRERATKENDRKIAFETETAKGVIQAERLRTERMQRQQRSEMEGEQLEADVLLERQRKDLVELAVRNERMRADAKAYDVAATMEALSRVDPKVLEAMTMGNLDPRQLMAQAFRELAAGADKIGQLNIAPDLLQSIAGKLQPGTAKGGNKLP